MALDVRVRFGNPQGVAGVSAQIRAEVIKRIGEATIDRVQARVDHPATRTLTARGVNQWSVDISGPRGGPGIIRPRRAKALRFTPKGGGVVFAKSVRGVGFGPLISAEAARVTADELDTRSVIIK